MTEKTLENKFERERQNHPDRWTLRTIFEPGYALRNALATPKSYEGRQLAIKLEVAADITKLLGYGYIVYQIANCFLD